MSSEVENVALLRTAYLAWRDSNGENPEIWTSIVAEDVRLQSLAGGASPMEFTAPRNGRAQLQEYFTELRASWEMKRFDIHEFVAQGDRVVALGNVAFEHKGTRKLVETPKVDVWRFKDGKAIEFFEMFDTAKAAACACS